MEETIEMNLVINMLELTFRAGKDKDRSSAEVQLNKLANNPLEMIKVLLKIISSEQTNGNFVILIAIDLLFIRIDQGVS